MASARDIPSLDGLRAISIAFVIVAHVIHPLARLGQHGVDVFFVISGFFLFVCGDLHVQLLSPSC